MSTLAPAQVPTLPATRVTATAAAVVGAPYALLNLYWATGGTALLAEYGAHVVGRAGEPAFRATSAVLAALMTVAVLAALALTRPDAGRVARWAAGLSGGWIGLYGLGMTFIGVAVPLALFGDSTFDPAVYRWHTLLFDPWFAVWGLLLMVTVGLSSD